MGALNFSHLSIRDLKEYCPFDKKGNIDDKITNTSYSASQDVILYRSRHFSLLQFYVSVIKLLIEHWLT